MNSTENAIFENSINNSNAQSQLPDRTSTPLPNVIDSTEQNHCGKESQPNMSPSSRDKSPSWDQQQSNTNASTTDNDTLDSEVRIGFLICYLCVNV